MSELNVYRWGIGTWMAMVLMLTTACAGPWKTIPGNLNAPQWSITTPPGWMHLSMPDSEMLSKNGPYLEYILIQARLLTTRFRFTNRVLNAGMLPREAAELIIDNLRADPLIRNFRLLTSEPAMIAGRSGFKLSYCYRDQHEVEIKAIYYGVLLSDLFFNMRFTAAQRYYFDEELPTFNEIFSSLQLVPIRDS